MEDTLQPNTADLRGSIYEMQLFLQAARAQYPNIPFVAADGIYGPERLRLSRHSKAPAD